MNAERMHSYTCSFFDWYWTQIMIFDSNSSCNAGARAIKSCRLFLNPVYIIKFFEVSSVNILICFEDFLDIFS